MSEYHRLRNDLRHERLAAIRGDDEELADTLKSAIVSIAKLEADRDALRKALDSIASWSEGPHVTPQFDEPEAARIARAALWDVRA